MYNQNTAKLRSEYFLFESKGAWYSIGVKVPSTSSLSVYTKVLAHNLNDIRNWASLIGLLLRICWCLLSVFLIYCSDEWKKLVNLIYCFQVLFRMNFKIMYFLMKILGNTPSADSAASRDSLSSQNATWGIVFFSSFYWWHIEYKGWMCERLLNLQEIYVSGQNICIEVYGNSVGTITPKARTSDHRLHRIFRHSKSLVHKKQVHKKQWFVPANRTRRISVFSHV